MSSTVIITVFSLVYLLPLATLIALLAGVGSWLLRNLLSKRTSAIIILIIEAHIIAAVFWLMITSLDSFGFSLILAFVALGQIIGSYLGWKVTVGQQKLAKLPEIVKLLIVGLVMTPYILIVYIPIITQLLNH